jgi:hypothetical protein
VTDTRISRDLAAERSPEEVYLALIQPVLDDVNRGTAGQVVLATTTLFIRQVDNGGLAAAFRKLSLDEIELALDSFDRLAAGQHAAIIRLALARLLEGDLPTSDEDMRTRIAELSPEWITENFEELDEQLYDERQLVPYFERFVAEHPEEFFLPG